MAASRESGIILDSEMSFIVIMHSFVSCTTCLKPYPQSSVPFRCPDCGGVYDLSGDIHFDLAGVNLKNRGVWKYSQSIGLDDPSLSVTMGEGDTPLIPDVYRGVQIAYKCEFQNPTGSYKDRGSTVLASFLKSRFIQTAVEDSSGNAGASFAAYAARAGLQASIYVPKSASGPKRDQIEAYGAQLVTIPGPRSNAAQAVLEKAQEGVCYASHAYLPFGMLGVATIAFEIFEQMGGIPGTVIAPAGHGSLLLGIARGFRALVNAGYAVRMPVLIGVQAEACDPISASFHGRSLSVNEKMEKPTIAEGVKVVKPVRMVPLIHAVRESGGDFISIPEIDIISARNELAIRGFYVEPTSALVWSALKKLKEPISEPVVLILTGSGLKSNYLEK